MSLIKLTAVPNPDIDGGQSAPAYIDSTRILMITRSTHEYAKLSSINEHRRLYEELYGNAAKLSEQVSAYIPAMTDPTAVEWMTRAREAAGRVTEAFATYAKCYNQPEYHPRQMCTEIQLACGTALEHGVMLARVWVMESPEEVFNLIEAIGDKNQPKTCWMCGHQFIVGKVFSCERSPCGALVDRQGKLTAKFAE